MDLSDFLGDQAVLDRPHAVGGGLLVAEGHRPKPEQAAARLAHIVDLLLETPGGGDDAELTTSVNEHRTPSQHRGVADPCHEGAGLGAISDPDGGRFGCDTRVAHIDVIAPGCLVQSRLESNGNVVGAGGVVEERKGPAGGVAVAGGVEEERFVPAGGVVAAGGVVLERTVPGGGVVAAGGVVSERTDPGGGVGAAGGVAEEGTLPIGGVVAAGAVVLQRKGPAGGVVNA